MTCTVHHIRGDQQTGKTTMALGFLERLERTAPAGRFAARGLYVGYTQANARHWQKTTPVQCVGITYFTAGEVAGRAAIVVDDCQVMDPQFFERVVHAWRHLDTLDCPTQLVLVNWPGEFPPKEQL